MAEETEVKTEEIKPAETVKTEEKPHPLAPGGERFNEVYRDMQDARRELAQAKLELEQEKSRARQPQARQQKFYTPAELDSMVQAGQITQSLASDQLAWQRAQEATAQIERNQEVRHRATSALSEVHQYMDKIPALANANSPEITKVKRAAIDIAMDMGKDVTDPVVQRRALREVFGSLEKVTALNKAEDHDRGRKVFMGEPGGGGGANETERQQASPLKGISNLYIEHWKRLGYNQKQMEDEAKYIVRSEPRMGDGRK